MIFVRHAANHYQTAFEQIAQESLGKNEAVNHGRGLRSAID